VKNRASWLFNERTALISGYAHNKIRYKYKREQSTISKILHKVNLSNFHCQDWGRHRMVLFIYMGLILIR